MKKLIGAFTLLAAPLAADPGAHIHPHGDDPFWSIAALLVAAVVVGAMMLRRK